MEPTHADCPICRQSVRLVDVRRGFRRLMTHGEIARSFVQCAGSGRRWQPPEKKTLAEDDVLEAMWEVVQEETSRSTTLNPSKTFKKRLFGRWRRMVAGYGKTHHVVVLVLGNGHWAVESGSRPGEYHAVDRNGDGLKCSCEAQDLGGNPRCRHTDLINKLQREEIIA